MNNFKKRHSDGQAFVSDKAKSQPNTDLSKTIRNSDKIEFLDD